MAGISNFLRPNSVVIFKKDPASIGKVIAFLLQRVLFPSDNHVRLDLAKSRDHGIAFDVTRNPVERIATDNVIRQPETLHVVGALSANPVGGVLDVAQGAGGSFIRRDIAEVNKLRAIANAREPVVVVTPERTYTSMVIASLSERYDERTGNGSAISLSFVEVRIVSPLAVGGVVDQDALNATFESLDMGLQVAAPVPDPGSLG